MPFDKEEFMSRIRAMSPEEHKLAVNRVIKAIFEPIEEEDPREDIDRMTDEEVTAYLVAEGFDVDGLHERLNQRIAEIQARLPAPQPSVEEGR